MIRTQSIMTLEDEVILDINDLYDSSKLIVDFRWPSGFQRWWSVVVNL